MRKPSRANRGRRPVADPVKWVAPIKGWRTDIPIADMPPDTASTLINWFPESGYARVRNGSAVWNVPSGNSVATDGTLLPYDGVTPKLFSVSNVDNKIYDVTISGTSTFIQNALNAHMSSTQIATGGGHYMISCPATGGPLLYDGTNWTTAAYTGLPADPTTLNVTTTYRERIYFLQKNSTYLWYGPTNGIAGALSFFDLGPDMKYGGFPVAISSWTKEVYTGILQFLVIATSVGEVLVFQGSNPADSTNWSLLGTFKLSPPLGADRCLTNIGADLVIMTADAVVPISQAIQADESAIDQVSLTKPIAPSFLDAAQTVGISAVGWSFVTFPARRMALVNVPDNGVGTYQLVMNTDTGAWCKFQGWSALTFRGWNNKLFFISQAGLVLQAEVGSVDGISAIGQTVPFNAIYCGPWERGDGISPKQPSMITVDAIIGPNGSIAAGVSADYKPIIPTAYSYQAPLTNVARWDVARWDIDVWPGQTPQRIYASPNCPIGIALAPSIQVLMNGQIGTPSAFYVYGGAILVEEGVYI